MVCSESRAQCDPWLVDLSHRDPSASPLGSTLTTPGSPRDACRPTTSVGGHRSRGTAPAHRLLLCAPPSARRVSPRPPFTARVSCRGTANHEMCASASTDRCCTTAPPLAREGNTPCHIVATLPLQAAPTTPQKRGNFVRAAVCAAVAIVVHSPTSRVIFFL